jgi:hypothetical protein
VAASLPVVMAVPPPAMPGVRQVGCVVHGALLRAGHGARQAVTCWSGWWWCNGTPVVMAAVCALSFIGIQLIAQRHGLVGLRAWCTYWAGAGSPASTARVGDGVGV